jgi:hypothetical protein
MACQTASYCVPPRYVQEIQLDELITQKFHRKIYVKAFELSLKKPKKKKKKLHF